MAQRKKHTAQFKAKGAFGALKERTTANHIASEYQVHAVQTSQWKKEALIPLTEGFGQNVGKKGLILQIVAFIFFQSNEN